VHVPIDQKVIDSEQGMADAFAASKLIPGKVDVSPYFISDFNKVTKGN
jgi:sulfonate transport system substrate-binding protein